MFEDYWVSTLSRENSREFQEVPQATCEDCLYEIREWEEQQEILRKTNSLHERELKTLTSSSLQSEEEYLKETNIDAESCEDNIGDKEDQEELLPHECNGNIEQSDQCVSSYQKSNIVPKIVLSGMYNHFQMFWDKCPKNVSEGKQNLLETSGCSSLGALYRSGDTSTRYFNF